MYTACQEGHTVADGSFRSGELFKFSQSGHGLFLCAAAYFRISFEIPAHVRIIGRVVNFAQIVLGQMDAPDTGGFAVGHAGQRGGYGDDDAAGSAAGSAFHMIAVLFQFMIILNRKWSDL